MAQEPDLKKALAAGLPTARAKAVKRAAAIQRQQAKQKAQQQKKGKP